MKTHTPSTASRIVLSFLQAQPFTVCLWACLHFEGTASSHLLTLIFAALFSGAVFTFYCFWRDQILTAIKQVSEEARINITHLRSWQDLRHDLARKRFSEMRHSVSLASDFLGGMGRGSFGHLSERQRNLLNTTAQELFHLNQSLEALFADKGDLLNIEDVRISSLRQAIMESRHHQLGQLVESESAPSADSFAVAIHPTIFAKCLDELFENCLHAVGPNEIAVELTNNRGSALDSRLEPEAPYCHLQVRYAICYLNQRSPWTKLLESEVHFQTELSLQFMKEVCEWHGGLAWTEWPKPHEVIIHIALPSAPTVQMEQAS